MTIGHERPPAGRNTMAFGTTSARAALASSSRRFLLAILMMIILTNATMPMRAYAHEMSPPNAYCRLPPPYQRPARWLFSDGQDITLNILSVPQGLLSCCHMMIDDERGKCLRSPCRLDDRFRHRYHWPRPHAAISRLRATIYALMDAHDDARAHMRY